MQENISNLSLAMHYANSCTPQEKQILLAFLTTNNLQLSKNVTEDPFSVASFFKKLTGKHASFVKKNKKRITKPKETSNCYL